MDPMTNWAPVSRFAARRHPLYGLKGWLLFFLAWQFLGALRALGKWRGALPKAHMGSILDFWASGASLARYSQFEIGVSLLAGFALCALALMRSENFRKRAIMILAIQWPLLMLGLWVIGAGAGVPSTERIHGFFAACFWLAVWGSYLHTSRRVRVTFESLVDSADAMLIPPTALVVAPSRGEVGKEA